MSLCIPCCMREIRCYQSKWQWTLLFPASTPTWLLMVTGSNELWAEYTVTHCINAFLILYGYLCLKGMFLEAFNFAALMATKKMWEKKKGGEVGALIPWGCQPTGCVARRAGLTGESIDMFLTLEPTASANDHFKAFKHYRTVLPYFFCHHNSLSFLAPLYCL